MSAGPGPLKVITAEPTGDIHHFADEVKTGDSAGFHRFGGEFAGIDSTERDFSLGIALSARKRLRPGVKGEKEIGNLGFGVLSQWFFEGVPCAPGLGKTARPEARENLQGGGTSALGSREGGDLFFGWEEIKAQSFPIIPE